MSADKIVVNASPTIFLAKLGCIDILSQLYSKIVVPQGVAAEINDGYDDDPAKRWLLEQVQCQVRPSPIPDIINQWNLGVGESEVIAYACRHTGFSVSIDDRQARRCAETFGLHITGTIGLLIKAKQQGLLDSLEDKLEELTQHGFRISDGVLEKALILSNEI